VKLGVAGTALAIGGATYSCHIRGQPRMVAPPLPADGEVCYAEHGCTLPLEEWARCLGGLGDEFDPCSYLEGQINQRIDHDAIRARRMARKRELVALENALPGVLDYLSDAKNSISSWQLPQARGGNGLLNASAVWGSPGSSMLSSVLRMSHTSSPIRTSISAHSHCSVSSRTRRSSLKIRPTG